MSSNFHELVCLVASYCQHRHMCYTCFCVHMHVLICNFIMDLSLEQKANIKFYAKLGKSTMETPEMLQTQLSSPVIRSLTGRLGYPGPVDGNPGRLQHSAASACSSGTRARILQPRNACSDWMQGLPELFQLTNRCQQLPWSDDPVAQFIEFLWHFWGFFSWRVALTSRCLPVTFCPSWSACAT